MKKYFVNVAWNRKASDYVEEHGWEELVKKNVEFKYSPYVFETLSFSTREEADAFILGVTMSNGWDSPYVESLCRDVEKEIEI